jgi:hypothetical protein
MSQGQHSVLHSSGRKIAWFATAVPIGALLLASVPLLTAFEAHVVNVTAKIERRPTSCDARSLGYWANHDGCSKGKGESIHAQKVREISQGLMGAFAYYTGEEICKALWMPNCGPGGRRSGQLCRARAQTLADLSNIAAGLLDTSALIAAADDGTLAFDRLGLTPYSTVDEALTAIELIILDPSSSALDLRHAAYVAARIYSFYEEENPFAPRCIYDPDEVPLCFERASDKQFRRESATTTEMLDLAAAAAAEALESVDVEESAADALGEGGDASETEVEHSVSHRAEEGDESGEIGVADEGSGASEVSTTTDEATSATTTESPTETQESAADDEAPTATTTEPTVSEESGEPETTDSGESKATDSELAAKESVGAPE